MSSILKVENLTKSYLSFGLRALLPDSKKSDKARQSQKKRQIRALSGVNMSVRKGDIYGLIGSNGAGKTTLMKMIAGIGYPDSGKIELFGQGDLNNQRRRISVLLDNMEPFPNMTVRENLTILQKSLGIPEPDTVEKLIVQFRFQEQAKQKVSHLSRGRRKKLSIAMALMGSPDFLILDEPMNGLDPQGMVEMRELFLRLKEDYHMTILLSSHILGELHKMATRYGIMKEGRLLEEITAANLEEKCRQYLEIGVTQINQAVSFLEGQGFISQYEVLPEQRVRIYDTQCDPAVLNRMLNNQGMDVFHLEVQGQELEQYFMERLGENYD